MAVLGGAVRKEHIFDKFYLLFLSANSIIGEKSGTDYFPGVI